MRALRAPAGPGDRGRGPPRTRPFRSRSAPQPSRRGHAPRVAPEPVPWRDTPLARQVPSLVNIELLVIPDCPNEAATVDLIATAVADTRVRATITRTVIASQDQARLRGFTGSPTILLDGKD